MAKFILKILFIWQNTRMWQTDTTRRHMLHWIISWYSRNWLNTDHNWATCYNSKWIYLLGWEPLITHTTVNCWATLVHSHIPTKTQDKKCFKWSRCSGVVVEYWTRNREVASLIHTGSTASNLEQVADVLCTQANSASYPQRCGKWVVAMAMRWRSSVADWSDGVSASCTVGPTVH